jgi:hypothetical protein
MANEDSQSISRALLSDDSQHLNTNTTNQLTASSTSIKPESINAKWSLRNSISSASLRRYRSSFRRGAMNNASINSQSAMPPSFPLFRRFYLMHSSITRKRPRVLPNSINNSDVLVSSEKFQSSSRIELSHIFTTIAITVASAFILIFMILLDFAYLNDAIPNPINHRMIHSNTENNITLCVRHPKVCVMKGLVIIVFIGITMTLCYSILTLHTRARRHSRLLERKTDELEKEKCLTEKLLHEILPPCVAKDLINGRKAPAEYYESVTVYFSDIVGFTIIARYYYYNMDLFESFLTNIVCVHHMKRAIC